MNSVNIEAESKKKVGNKKIFIGLFILVVAVVILAIFFLVEKTNPKKVFETSLDKIFETINKNEKEDIKTVSGKLDINLDVKSKEYMEIFDIINDIDLSFDYNVDYENKKVKANINSFYKNKDLINIDFYSKEEMAYMFLKNLYDKYIEIPMEGFNEMFESKDLTKDIETIMEHLEKSIDKSLKKEYFSSKKTKITINGKDTSVIENILDLNKENQKKLAKDIFNELNNDEFIEALANINGMDKDTIKENLEDILNEDYDVTDNYTISIYTKNMANEFIGFKMMENNTDVLSVIKEQEDTYKFNIDDFEGTVKITENKDEYKLEFAFDIEGINLNLNLNLSYKINENFEDLDISNSISYEKLTEEDMEKIYNNMMNNEGIKELMEIFNTTLGALTNTTF